MVGRLAHEPGHLILYFWPSVTAAEREDLVASAHAGFIELIARSRRECSPGTGLSLQSVEKELGIATDKVKKKRPARRERWEVSPEPGS